ncbi:MAG: MmcQ/YjbR family DNA-binding protein [Labilithrix sp.]|nr:MmcQ/YjbR family DNA-binding protein [Labilithrix sp.]MCW5836355.1 MmcQ/YjbR family DNA-binding protein [Labilithrix sp.]
MAAKAKTTKTTKARRGAGRGRSEDAETSKRGRARAPARTERRAGSVTFATARAIARAFPGVEESTSYGTPALKVRGKLFARLKEDGETLAVKVALEARAALIEARPDALFVTDHYLAYPYVLVRLGAVTRSELAALLEEAWRMTAPPRIAGARVARR